MSRRRQHRIGLSLESWPTCDREAWVRALVHAGAFDVGGTAAEWAPATRAWAIRCYGRWLSFNVGRPGWSRAARPGHRITKTAVAEYITGLRTRVAPCSAATEVVALKVMAKALEPATDWRWLERVSSRLSHLAEPARDKRSRMRPIAEVFGAAYGNLEVLRKTSLTSRAHRIAFRDSLMLALLSARPLRLKNFHTMEIGRHLLECGNGQIVMNRVHLEFFFPPALQPFLHIYRERVRPTFGPLTSCNTLWLSYSGDPISANEARCRIKLISKRLIGVEINPHLLRDIAATELAEASPDGILGAAALLGHRNLETTERYYVRANRLNASRSINDALAAIGLR
jgi:integrase/recombinase XerD